MAQASIYVRVGSDYIKFTKKGEYKTVSTSSQATVFNNRATASRACKECNIKDFKLVSTNIAKRF